MLIIYGGDGFIGRNLSIKCHEVKHPAVVVHRNIDQDFFNAHADSLALMHIKKFFSKEGEALLERATSMVYLASNTVPATNMNKPVSEINQLQDFANTIEYVSGINNKLTIIYLSSGGQIYGGHHTEPISESAPCLPATPYALIKVMAEEYLHYHNRASSQPCIILRVANPVGIGHRNTQQGVVAAIINAIKENKKITIFGDGENVRDYFDVRDLAQAIYLASQYKANGNVCWNAGSGQGLTINQVIATVEDMTGSRVQIHYEHHREIDVRYNVLDCSLIKATLGWESTLDFADSVKTIIAGAY